jgi:hypothetical protein
MGDSSAAVGRRSARLTQTERDAAFSDDAGVVSAARARIIESGSVEAFYDCVRRARNLGRQGDLEFWLVEIVTGRGHTRTIATGILEFVEEVLEPGQRWTEALLYLRYIEPAVGGSLRERLQSMIERVEGAREWLSEIETTEGWRKGANNPLRLDDKQHTYDAVRAHAASQSNESLTWIESSQPENFLPNMAGFFIGLMKALTKSEIDAEVAARAWRDNWVSKFPEIRPKPLPPTTGLPEGRQSMRW